MQLVGPTSGSSGVPVRSKACGPSYLTPGPPGPNPDKLEAMAKVLLINPPSETLGPDNLRITMVLYPSPPAGIALVAACLERAGHTVAIVDLVIEPQSENAFLETVRKHSPDAVGFSVLGPSFHASQSCMRSIRKALPSVRLQCHSI